MITNQSAPATASAPIAAAQHSATANDTNLHYVFYWDNYRVGIYGWRKRCLYLFVTLLMIMVIINVALTVWIVKVLDFSIDGMGRLRILSKTIRLHGDTELMKHIYATKISSRKVQPLKILSNKNITLNARNKQGIINSRLSIGSSIIEAIGEKFTIRNPDNKILFEANNTNVYIGTRGLSITGNGGIRFTESIQTPMIKAVPYQQLRLESPTRRLQVKAPRGIAIESKRGNISASCLKDMKLQSKGGVIWLDSEEIKIRNLKTILPTVRGRTYHGIYQLCICDNGRIFLSLPQGHCRADDFQRTELKKSETTKSNFRDIIRNFDLTILIIFFTPRRTDLLLKSECKESSYKNKIK